MIFQNGRQCTSRDFVDSLVTLVHQNIRVFCEVLQIISDCKAVKLVWINGMNCCACIFECVTHC